MSETLKGKGVIWGFDLHDTTRVNEFTCTGAVISSTDLPQSADLSYQSDKEELRDGTGEVAGACYYNATKTVSITVLPSAATISAAITNAAAMIVAPGTQVVITDADSADTAGNYILESCRLRRTNTSAALVEMDLISYANDITATVAT